MSEQALRDRRILVVEDEFILCEELRSKLGDARAIVVGPAATILDALALVRSGQHIDGAFLDVNLGGEPVFPVADLLAERRVPFVFTTGYDSSAIPSRFGHVSLQEKPIDMRKVLAVMRTAIDAAAAG